MTLIGEIEMLSIKKQALEEKLRIESFQMLLMHNKIQEIKVTCISIKTRISNHHRLKDSRKEIQMQLMSHLVSNQLRICDLKASEVKTTFHPKIS